MKTDTLIKQLFSTQAHWGHQKQFRNPKLKDFIYTTIHKVDIINLEFTVQQMEVSKAIIKRYHTYDILLISTRGKELNVDSITKWKPGTLTNFQFGRLDKMPKLIVVDNAEGNAIALKEAKICNIPTIGFCDTNCDLTNIDQFIIVNDDNDNSINFVLNYLFN